MTNEELNTALYKKMFAEQEQFKDWLLTQAPERILEHSYEYTVREDFLLSLEYNDLTSSQAAALLASPTPLDDLFHQYEKMESSHMEEVWSCFENRAEQVKSMQAETMPPLYLHNAAYAREHGELEQYRASRHLNIACKDEIEQAIPEHYRNNRLEAEAAANVLEQYGAERVQYVLANTIQEKDWDQRFSRSNREWADSVNIPPDPDAFGSDRNLDFVVDCHAGLVNLFVDRVREQLREQEKEKPSVLQQLRQEPSAHKAAPPKKKEPER